MTAPLLKKQALLFMAGFALLGASPVFAENVRCEAYCLKTETQPVAYQGYSETVAWSKRYYADAKDTSSAIEMLVANCKTIGGNKLLGDFSTGRSRMLPFTFLGQSRAVNAADCRPNIASGIGPDGEI